MRIQNEHVWLTLVLDVKKHICIKYFLSFSLFIFFISFNCTVLLIFISLFVHVNLSGIVLISTIID